MADALLAAHGRGGRVAAPCVGAFILTPPRMLDGRPATTHWQRAADFAERFPAVDLRPADPFVGQDGVYTAPRVTATLDLTLHLLEDDLGAAAAAAAARFLIAPMRREGGQAPYIEYGPAHRLTDLRRAP
jgi:transcriptional regulator GlxA family with amidase domain